jgi:hypothetical protein
MSFKVIMTWDIIPEKEREYFEFIVREFIPGMQRAGFNLTDAWATVYGKQPQILIATVLPTMQQINQILEQLMGFVHNFNLKVVDAKSTFQF